MITPKFQGGHEVTRPVLVEGAEIGDALTIRLCKVRVTSLATSSGVMDFVDGRYVGDPFVAKLCPACCSTAPSSHVEGIGDDAVHCNSCGAELCLNALRCAGYWARTEMGFGTAFQFSCTSDLRPGIAIDGHAVTVHLPMAAQAHAISASIQLVLLDGIAHFVERVGAFSPDEDMPSRLDVLAVAHAELLGTLPAIGLIETMDAGENALRIKPLVKVLTSQTLYLETACGSGSVAATIAARPPDASEVAILQPSGATLAVRIDHDSIAFSGPVTPVAKVAFDLDRAELLTLE